MSPQSLFYLYYFKKESPYLNSLVVRECRLESNDLYTLYPQAGENSEPLSELTTLDMSLNVAIGGSLSSLMCHYLRHLQILVLRRCGLNSDDLISLSRASNLCRLPELRHLDISQNNFGCETGALFKLFAEHSGFLSLINLMLCDCRLEL